MRRDFSSNETIQKMNYSGFTKSAVWSNDFSSATDWTIGTDSPDGAHWAICTYSTAPVDWIPVLKMTGTFASETVDNGFALFNSDQQGGEGSPMQDAWIKLNVPINLSAVGSPRFVFTSYYKKWKDIVYFDYSIDGGATWNSKELFTDIVQGGITPVNRLNFINVPEVGNQLNVLIRFRFSGDYDYGVFIDDVYCVDAPEYDLQLLETATNFFQIIDYHADGDGYHYSSHNGMIPYSVLTDPNAFIVFNSIVKNNGIATATPQVTVKIKDSNSTEVYNFTYTSDLTLAPGEIDTLDIAWENGEEFYVTTEDWVFGKYTIDFEAAVVGQVDAVPGNNTYSTYFYATDNVYAKDGGNLNGNVGPGKWIGHGNDGDMFGVDYTLFETTVIDSVQTYITSSSDAGTSLICHVFTYNSVASTWESVGSSDPINIEEEHLGTWLSFTFPDPAVVTLPSEESSIDIRVALEFYYNGASNVLWVGEDKTVPSSLYSTCWKFVGEDWTYISNYYGACPMIRACLPVLGVSANQTVAANVNVYPNPSTGILNVNNVEGSSIEILNIVGQTIAIVKNASEINTIDLSNQANGTYFVRVIKGNEVSTTKINIVK